MQVVTGIPTMGLEEERVTATPEAQDSDPPTLLENEVDIDVEGSKYWKRNQWFAHVAMAMKLNNSVEGESIQRYAAVNEES